MPCPLSVPFPKSGPFPRPALPGVLSRTGLSATLPARTGPRGFPVGVHPPPTGLPVLLRFPSSAHADAITPAETVRCVCRLLPGPPPAFPFLQEGRLPRLSFEACSAFTRVPACAVAEPPKHPCFESSPDSAFSGGFRRSCSGFSTFPSTFPSTGPSTGRRNAGMPRQSGRGDLTGASDSFCAPQTAAGHGPRGRQPAAAPVRSSHMRRSRSRAFAVTISFRMTAVTATLWGFPLSFSRPWNSAISGLNRVADIAAM